MNTPPPTRRGPHLLTLLVLLLLTGALAAAQRREDPAPPAPTLRISGTVIPNTASVNPGGFTPGSYTPDPQLDASMNTTVQPPRTSNPRSTTDHVGTNQFTSEDDEQDAAPPSPSFDPDSLVQSSTSGLVMPDEAPDALATEPTAAPPTDSWESTTSNNIKKRANLSTATASDLVLIAPNTLVLRDSVVVSATTPVIPNTGSQQVSGTFFAFTGPLPVTYSYAWPTASASLNVLVALALLLATGLVVERLVRTRLRLSLAELLLAVTVAAVGLFFIQNYWQHFALGESSLALRIILLAAAYCALLLPTWACFQLLRIILNNRRTTTPA